MKMTKFVILFSFILSLLSLPFQSVGKNVTDIEHVEFLYDFFDLKKPDFVNMSPDNMYYDDYQNAKILDSLFKNTYSGVKFNDSLLKKLTNHYDSVTVNIKEITTDNDALQLWLSVSSHLTSGAYFNVIFQFNDAIQHYIKALSILDNYFDVPHKMIYIKYASLYSQISVMFANLGDGINSQKTAIENLRYSMLANDSVSVARACGNIAANFEYTLKPEELDTAFYYLQLGNQYVDATKLLI